MSIDLSAQIDKMARPGQAAGRYVPASELRAPITAPERITLPDAELMLWRELFTGSESAGYFQGLSDGVDWQQDRITLFGRTLNSPRLTAWYGETGVTYAYSGLSLVARGWLAGLLGIRERVGQAAGKNFNSVLLNLYRNEADSMGWHSDDETSLGPNSVIGSVSFGATRTFQLQHKRRKASRSVILRPKPWFRSAKPRSFSHVRSRSRPWGMRRRTSTCWSLGSCASTCAISVTRR